MRWKALEFLGKLDKQVKDNYGFKSTKCPPSGNELSSFESDLLMVSHKNSSQQRKRFLSKLKEDVKIIKNTKELLITVTPISHLIFLKWIKTHTTNVLEKMSLKHKKSNRSKVN